MEKDNKQHGLPEVNTTHYYGDIVRRLLLAAGIILLFAILVDREYLSFYLLVGVFGALAFTILAGLTSPLNRFVISANVVISAVMFLIFEYFAIDAYLKTMDFFDSTFFLRQLLAVVFIAITYYSTKTLRWMRADN